MHDQTPHAAQFWDYEIELTARLMKMGNGSRAGVPADKRRWWRAAIDDGMARTRAYSPGRPRRAKRARSSLPQTAGTFTCVALDRPGC